MARILPLYALLVVAIMKSTAAITTMTMTAEGTTITGTDMATSMSSDTHATMSSLGTTAPDTSTTDLILSSSSLWTATVYTDWGPTLTQTSMATPMPSATLSSLGTTAPDTSTTDLISSSLWTATVYTDWGPTLTQTSMATPMPSATLSSLGTTAPDTSTTDLISSSLWTATATEVYTDWEPTLPQTSMTTPMSSAIDATMSSLGTTAPDTSTTDLISSSLWTATELITASGPTLTQTSMATPMSSATDATMPSTETTTEPPTEPSTEEPPRVGPVPEPTLPDIDGDANKTYQFEFAVEEDTTKGCRSDNLTSPACDAFKYNVTQELEAVYGESDAFESVEVVLILRNGSLIVSHTVTYSYNEMSDEERMASARDIYDETLGSAVADGNLGDYTVQEDCGSCAPPAETSAISSRTAKCPSEYSEPSFETNYWVCESTCFTNRDYCNLHGFCWQRGNLYSQPLCSCDWDSGEWYWGYRCQYYMNQMHLIIGCSCGAAVLLVLLVCLIAYCVVTPKAISDKDSQSSESVIDVFVPPILDTKDGNTLQGNRPDTYIYSGKLGAGSTNVESSSFIGNQNGGPQRESRPDVNEDAAKRRSNGSVDNRHSPVMKPNGSSQQRNPEFWGNLNEPSAEHIKLEPFLDDNDSYKIQRPHVSGHYNYSNTEPDPYQIMDIPEPDYAQR